MLLSPRGDGFLDGRRERGKGEILCVVDSDVKRSRVGEMKESQ